MKQVSFSLFPEQVKIFKTQVDPSIQSKMLRKYILNDYQLPRGLHIINKGDKKALKIEKFLFDESTDIRLNQMVQQIREAGYTANRSSLMRNIMMQLLEKLEKHVLPLERKIHNSSFYFEKGTKEVLEQYIPFRDRNATIERFILEEYVPSYNHSFLLAKPEERESMRISIDKAAIQKLDFYVKDIHIKGITRTALMRDVIMQLITKSSKMTI